jgi:hypothetical protein
MWNSLLITVDTSYIIIIEDIPLNGKNNMELLEKEYRMKFHKLPEDLDFEK